MEIKTLHGKETIQYVDAVASLRLSIFREYPYLYEGTIASEERYLSRYTQSQLSIFVVAKDHGSVVGVITGLPICEYRAEIKEAFAENAISLEDAFYLGDILVSKEYRKKGIGHMMYQAFEKAVKTMGSYKKIALCEIDRSEKDVNRPRDYRSLDDFWKQQGFIKHRNIIMYSSWKEVGSTEETKHSMVFSIKNL